MAYAPGTDIGTPKYLQQDATSRIVSNGVTVGAAWSAAQACAIHCPVGVKAIIANVITRSTALAVGICGVEVSFSNTTVATPSYLTAHAKSGGKSYAGAIGNVIDFFQQVLIPLNSSGQFYMYADSITNTTAATMFVTVADYIL